MSYPGVGLTVLITFQASLFISENESVDYRILIEYADALFGLKEFKRAIV